MKHPTEYHRVVQPLGSSLCGACVCAMLTSQTLEEVLAEVDWRTLLTTCGVAKYLMRYNILMGAFFVTPDGEIPRHYIDLCLPFDRPALMSVASKVFPGSDHWVLWDGQKVLDPSPRAVENETYEVKEIYLVSYWEREEATQRSAARLPADWRDYVGEVPDGD